MVVDICTPAEAADPLTDGRMLRLTSSGDISTSMVFDLEEQHVYERKAAFPIGAEISLTVEVLNAGDVPVAKGKTETVKVHPVTRVCACLTRLQQAELELCEGVGCFYDLDADRCTFYALPH